MARSQYSNQTGDDTGGVARQKVERACLEVAMYREEYLERVQFNATDDPDWNRSWHAKVMNYYLELRPYRNADCLKGRWQNASLWPRDGQWESDPNGDNWVIGIDKLSQYVDRQETVINNSGGYGTTNRRETQAKPLKPRRLLRASIILDEIARLLGISLNVQKGQRPLHMLDEREPHYDPEEKDDIESPDADGGGGE